MALCVLDDCFADMVNAVLPTIKMLEGQAYTVVNSVSRGGSLLGLHLEQAASSQYIS